MDIADFDYDLPPDRIAQRPLAEREASRLMLLPRREGAPQHRSFRELPDLLAPGDLLVVNRSRVFPARLLGRRSGGGAAEVLLLARLSSDEWHALLRPGRRLRPGDMVTVSPQLAVHILDGPPAPPDCALSRSRSTRSTSSTRCSRCPRGPLTSCCSTTCARTRCARPFGDAMRAARRSSSKRRAA